MIKKKMQAGGVMKSPAKRVGPVDPNGAYTKVQERTLAGAKAAKTPLVKDKELGASKMKMGGSLKPVPADKKGLAKLPTPVRNKMGFQKNGGKMAKQAAVAIAMKKTGKTPKKK